jgi:hypothetical protein
MSRNNQKRTYDTLSPTRNFTLTLEDRMRALTIGPPYYSLRLRRIEELEQGLIEGLAAFERENGAIQSVSVLPEVIHHNLAEMNRLISNHNSYYPIEANLPIDVNTGRLVDWGQPWSPRPLVNLDELIAISRRPPAEQE